MRRILHPIDTIVSAMKEVQKGASNQKIEVKGTNELWQLAEQYNNMIDALQRQQEEVQRILFRRAMQAKLTSGSWRRNWVSVQNISAICSPKISGKPFLPFF
jgi:methyl-accepting chemotaxis protein